MLNEDYIKKKLEENCKTDLDKIIGGEYLGLSRNVRQINSLFSRICKTYENDKYKLMEIIEMVSEYLIITRGKNTPSIKNALDLIFVDFKSYKDLSVSIISEQIILRTDQLNEESIRNAEIIANFGANLLSKSKLIMAFDYSSSVMNVLSKLADNNNYATIIVPESRILNGGFPIAEEAIKMGHKVEFIFDMAFCLKLKDTDAILIGAESFDINGDCWNTIGSYPISLLAFNYKVPVYVPTEFIKFNYKSLTNMKKEIISDSFKDSFNLPREVSDSKNISFYCEELEKIPAKYLKSYITPLGNISPEQMEIETRKYFKIS